MARNQLRYFSLWVPSWSVASVWMMNGSKPQVPTVVFDHEDNKAKVIATCPQGFAQGIRRGMKMRSAQATCPDALFEISDALSETKSFDTVLDVVREMVPRVSMVRPGRLEFDGRGPTRYFGGEVNAGIELIKRVRALGIEDVFVGIGDTRFASYVGARLAPYNESEDNVFCTPNGHDATKEFLIPQPISLLDSPEIVSLLSRVGLSTLGDILEIDSANMLARFGEDGLHVYNLVAGVIDEKDVRTLALESENISEKFSTEDPLISSEQAGFVAKTLSHSLCERLNENGLMCSELEIVTHLSNGESHVRSWRVESSSFEHSVAKRVLLQCEEWLKKKGNEEISFADREIIDSYPRGVVRIVISATHVVASHRRQVSLFGADPARDEDALKAIERIKTIVGDESVSELLVVGGRMPSEIVSVGSYSKSIDDLTSKSLFDIEDTELSCKLHWPGSVIGRAPMLEYKKPIAAKLLDKNMRTIKVHANGLADSDPVFIESVLFHGRKEVINFAGPWPLEDRWWDDDKKRRYVRYQIACEGNAFLIMLRGDNAEIVGTY